MKLFNALTIGATLLAASLTFGSPLQAQAPFFRTTHVSFSAPVEIPGKILPAGDYIIQLAPGDMNNVILIRDKDGTNTIATLLTITDYRLNPTSNTVMLFKERAADAPQALRAWFYPGENFGHEFVYPRKRATELAAANQVNVPSVADNTSDADLSGAHVTEATPSGGEEEVATTETPATPSNAQVQTSTTPAPSQDSNTYSSANSTNNASNNLEANNQPLPKTASDVYSVALGGGIFIGAGFMLGSIARRRSQGQLG